MLINSAEGSFLGCQCGQLVPNTLSLNGLWPDLVVMCVFLSNLLFFLWLASRHGALLLSATPTFQAK